MSRRSTGSIMSTVGRAASAGAPLAPLLREPFREHFAAGRVRLALCPSLRLNPDRGQAGPRILCRSLVRAARFGLVAGLRSGATVVGFLRPRHAGILALRSQSGLMSPN